MRGYLNATGRWMRANWFWPLVLLALPNCGFQTNGLPSGKEYAPGSYPISSAIMCDIPKVQPNDFSPCVDPATVMGMPLKYGAIALVQGETNSLALDFSSTQCPGQARVINFEGPFPNGLTVCINCGTQKPFPYKDGNEVCVAQCIDLVNLRGVEPPGGAKTFCEANAHVSTNFDKTQCYPDACGVSGEPNLDFDDPRKYPDIVTWRKDSTLIGVEVTNNGIKRIADTTSFGGDSDFNASAIPIQTITTGDGWVEFAPGETGMGHVLGVSPYLGITDTTPGLSDIDFAILLDTNGKVYVRENNAVVGSDHGTYTAGERFRVHFTDNNDMTATISYGRLLNGCVPVPGLNLCAEDIFATQTIASPAYPLRIDTSFKEKDASLVNVTVVTIKE